MKGLIRKAVMFAVGGSGYVGLELLWRGRSHSSMFVAGGACFLLLGQVDKKRLPLLLRAVAGSGIITGVELVTGLLWNRDHRVWDYRSLPGQWGGQICLPYSLLWVPVGLGAMSLYRILDRCISGKKDTPLPIK